MKLPIEYGHPGANRPVSLRKRKGFDVYMYQRDSGYIGSICSNRVENKIHEWKVLERKKERENG
jgi:hypothetical protein